MLLWTHSGPQENATVGIPMVAVETQHLQQGELWADICIHEEEGWGSARQDLVPEVIDSTSSTQGSKFLEIPTVSREIPQWQSTGHSRNHVCIAAHERKCNINTITNKDLAKCDTDVITEMFYWIELTGLFYGMEVYFLSLEVTIINGLDWANLTEILNSCCAVIRKRLSSSLGW